MNDDISGAIYRSKVRYTATYTGYYYLWVMWYHNGWTSVDYTLSIVLLVPPQNVSCWWSIPEHATATTPTSYTQTWNWSTWTPITNWWVSQATCDFNCNSGYSWDWTSCNELPPECNLLWNVPSYTPFNFCTNINILNSLNNIPTSTNLTNHPWNRDVYSFILEAWKIYDIETLWTNPDTVIYLYNNQGWDYLIMNDDISGAIYRSKVRYTATYTGYYYLWVMWYHNGWTSVDYTLSINLPFSPKDVSCWWSIPEYATATTSTTYTQTWNWSARAPITSWWENQTTCDFNCNSWYLWYENACMNITVGGNSCSSEIPANSIITLWTPLVIDQDWQNTNPSNACYFTCNSWFDWDWNQCLNPLLSKISEGIYCGWDFSSWINNYWGNKFIHPNAFSFAAVKEDWSITAWGDSDDGWSWYSSDDGGINEPTDNGYVSIYPNPTGFVGLKPNGSLTAWWDYSEWPTDSGFVSIYSSSDGYAALRPNGSIIQWETVEWGPIDGWYISISSNGKGFAALKSGGGIVSWWNPIFGWGLGPIDSWYVSITSNGDGYAALKANGSITAWGYPTSGWEWEPTDSWYVSIYSTYSAFAALKEDWSITAWWNVDNGWEWEPTDSWYISISSNGSTFAALKSDWTIKSWGYWYNGWEWEPTDSWYVSITANNWAFAALKADWSITAWGGNIYGWTWEPTDSWYISIYSTTSSFAALKADWSIKAWWILGSAWANLITPTDSWYISISSTSDAYAALKADWGITAWWNWNNGWEWEPTDKWYLQINGTWPNTPKNCVYKRQ